MSDTTHFLPFPMPGFKLPGARFGLPALLCLAGALLSHGATVDFDNATPGRLPPHWTSAITGEGAAIWSVQPESSAPSGPNVLKQSGLAPGPAFPLCLFDHVVTNGFVEVRFKTLSGTNDQAAGLVWRAQDARNYYVCRANALENNVVLYKVQDAKRTPLDIRGRKGGYGVGTPVAPATWHTLRVTFHGRLFAVALNGKNLFEVEDPAFAGPGRIGLWTKADSVTLFDDFRFEP